MRVSASDRSTLTPDRLMAPANRARRRPLQPHKDLDSDLHEFEALEAARSLQRAADAEIINLLQYQSFADTPEWRALAKVLIEYGYTVIMAWLVTGVVRAKAAAHAGGRGVVGLGRIPEGLQLDRDDAHALTVELITTAVTNFRTKTLPDPKRTWRADGGASLKTYFIGRSLMDLPDTYERWEHATGPPHQRLDKVPDDGRHSTDPADQAIAATLIDVVTSPEDRAIFELDEQGYTDAEIGELLNLTEGQVRTRKTRARHDAQRHR